MDNSPFNKLPAELRVCIYQLVLVQEDAIVLVADESNDLSCKAQVAKKSIKKHMLALTSTCKQVRNETMPILLGENHFKVSSSIPLMRSTCLNIEPCTAMVAWWIIHLGRWASCLKSMELELSDYADDIGEPNHHISRTIHALRGLLRPLKLRLTVAITGFRAALFLEDAKYYLTAYINDDPRHLVMDRLNKDFEQLKARIKMEESPMLRAESIIEAFDKMRVRGVSEVLDQLDKY